MPCAMNYTPWTYRCSTPARAGQVKLNDDWEHCPGRHEAAMLRQVALQNASKPAPVQLAVDLLNRLGVVLGVSGNPGIGKSTVSALSTSWLSLRL